jgi:putative ABC transport system permease protein
MLLQGEDGSVQAELAPTGEGDPLLLKWASVPETHDEIVLSHSAAQRMGVYANSMVTGLLSRTMRQEDRVSIQLRVIAVLPDYAYTKAAAFVQLELLDAVEDFRNGFAVPSLGWAGAPRPDFSGYAGFRIAARDPASVQRLQQALTAQGIEVYTRAEDIELVQNLDRAFTLVFGVLFSVVAAGAFAAAASNALGQIARKRRSLAVLRLLGFSSGHLVIFGLVQSAITGFLAAIGASGLYLIVQTAINHYFSGGMGQYEAVCRLDMFHHIAAILLSSFLMMLASACSSRTLMRIEPAEALRDV